MRLLNFCLDIKVTFILHSWRAGQISLHKSFKGKEVKMVDGAEIFR